MSIRTKKVIKLSSMPSRSPAGFGILWWLLLDRLNAPIWAYGLLWTVVGLLAVAFIASWWTEKPCDVPGFGEPK
jgi:hypothetical protein